MITCTLRRKTFLGPLKSSKNMLSKPILIGLFVLKNNKRTKKSSGRVGKAIVPTSFSSGGYSWHRELEFFAVLGGTGINGLRHKLLTVAIPEHLEKYIPMLSVSHGIHTFVRREVTHVHGCSLQDDASDQNSQTQRTFE